MNKPDWIKICVEHWRKRDWGLVTDEPCLICERDTLREDVDYHTATTKRIMSEKCPTDEQHCTCVPYLRERVRELEANAKANFQTWLSGTETAAERDKLREDYQYLVECHDILQRAYATDSKTIKELRERVRDLVAEVHHRTEWENHYRAKHVESETHLTKAKGAMLNWSTMKNHYEMNRVRYEALREAEENLNAALTELEDKSCPS